MKAISRPWIRPIHPPSKKYHASPVIRQRKATTSTAYQSLGFTPDASFASEKGRGIRAPAVGDESGLRWRLDRRSLGRRSLGLLDLGSRSRSRRLGLGLFGVPSHVVLLLLRRLPAGSVVRWLGGRSDLRPGEAERERSPAANPA